MWGWPHIASPHTTSVKSKTGCGDTPTKPHNHPGYKNRPSIWGAQLSSYSHQRLASPSADHTPADANPMKSAVVHHVAEAVNICQHLTVIYKKGEGALCKLLLLFDYVNFTARIIVPTRTQILFTGRSVLPDVSLFPFIS